MPQTPSTDTSRTEGDTTPPLSRAPATKKPQSSLSRLYCKLTMRPDDLTVEKALTEISRQGKRAQETEFDAALYTHFKDKVNRGLETEIDLRPEPSSPSVNPISRAFKALDGFTKSKTLQQTLTGIDHKLWLHETARSGGHGYAARGYMQGTGAQHPLNWKNVRDLRDEAVSVAEARLAALDEAEATASSQASNYGSFE